MKCITGRNITGFPAQWGEGGGGGQRWEWHKGSPYQPKQLPCPPRGHLILCFQNIDFVISVQVLAILPKFSFLTQADPNWGAPVINYK